MTGFTHLSSFFLCYLISSLFLFVFFRLSFLFHNDPTHTHTFYTHRPKPNLYTHTMSAYVKSCYPAGTPVFEPMSPVFEDRTHPASLTPCGVHNPALLELIRTDVSREMVCKFILQFTVQSAYTNYKQTTSPTEHHQSLHAPPLSPHLLPHLPLPSSPLSLHHHLPPVYPRSRRLSLSSANSPMSKSLPSSLQWSTSSDYDTDYPRLQRECLVPDTESSSLPSS